MNRSTFVRPMALAIALALAVVTASADASASGEAPTAKQGAETATVLARESAPQAARPAHAKKTAKVKSHTVKVKANANANVKAHHAKGKAVPAKAHHAAPAAPHSAPKDTLDRNGRPRVRA